MDNKIIQNLLHEEITWEDAVSEMGGSLEFPGYIPEFLQHLADSDKIYSWSTSKKSWELLAGRAGLAIVRDGEVIRSILTVMN